MHPHVVLTTGYARCAISCARAYGSSVEGSNASGRQTRSRAGNRDLKIAFHHAAIRAIQYFPAVKAEFLRWQRRTGTPIARALVANELATIVYAMRTTAEPFHRQFHGQPVVTQQRCTWPRLATPPAELMPVEALRTDWGARRHVDGVHLHRRARRTV